MLFKLSDLASVPTVAVCQERERECVSRERKRESAECIGKKEHGTNVSSFF